MTPIKITALGVNPVGNIYSKIMMSMASYDIYYKMLSMINKIGEPSYRIQKNTTRSIK